MLAHLHIENLLIGCCTRRLLVVSCGAITVIKARSSVMFSTRCGEATVNLLAGGGGDCMEIVRDGLFLIIDILGCHVCVLLLLPAKF